MDSDQLDQYRMAGAVDQLLAERADELTPSAVAVQEAADVRAAYALLSQKMGDAPVATKDVTENAGTQQTALETLLPALTGPLQSHARKTGNAELLAAATLRSKQLEKLRPPQLRDLVAALLKHATAHAEALQAYGFSAAVRQKFDAALAAFSATVGATQGLIDKRQLAGLTADQLLAELMQQLYELDDPMDVFVALNPDLHQAYQLARRVGRSRGRSKRKGGEGSGEGPQG